MTDVPSMDDICHCACIELQLILDIATQIIVLLEPYCSGVGGLW